MLSGTVFRLGSSLTTRHFTSYTLSNAVRSKPSIPLVHTITRGARAGGRARTRAGVRSWEAAKAPTKSLTAENAGRLVVGGKCSEIVDTHNWNDFVSVILEN